VDQFLVVASLAALQLHKEAKELVKFQQHQDSSPVLSSTSRDPVTAGNNTGHQAAESGDTLAVLSNIRVRVIVSSTIAAGIAGLSVLITVRSLHLSKFAEEAFFYIYCAAAGALMGFAFGTFLAEVAVAQVFRTLNHEEADIVVVNTNAAELRRKGGKIHATRKAPRTTRRDGR
jgi:hypothetical protein